MDRRRRRETLPTAARVANRHEMDSTPWLRRPRRCGRPCRRTPGKATFSPSEKSSDAPAKALPLAKSTTRKLSSLCSRISHVGLAVDRDLDSGELHPRSFDSSFVNTTSSLNLSRSAKFIASESFPGQGSSGESDKVPFECPGLQERTALRNCSRHAAGMNSSSENDIARSRPSTRSCALVEHVATRSR